MKLTFRQGIVACQTNSATPPVANFLQRSSGDTRYFDLVVSPLPTIITFAHGSSNYIIEERNTVSKAWGPFDNAAQTPYLFWDINPVTAELTRGVTLMPPVAQQSWPASITPAADQHWFDTTNNLMKVWNGTKWLTKVRVFAAKIVNSSTVLYEQIGSSQVGLNITNDAGYIVSDADGKPMRKNYQGELFTSDTNFYLNFSQSSSSVKLEGSELIATASETIPAFSAVSISGVNKVGLANSALATKQVVGLVTVDLMPGESSNVVFRGNVYNALWNWPLSSVGQSLYCGTAGELTVTRPSTLNTQKVGVVLSPQSIFFQVDDETIPAELTASGIQTVSVSSPLTVSGSANIVLGIDPVTITSAGIMTASDKQVLENLVIDLATETMTRTSNDELLAPKANPVFTGSVTLGRNPTGPLEAATKNYVDTIALSGKENTGVAQALMDTHLSTPNPHLQYVLNTDFVNATAGFVTDVVVTQTVVDHLTAHMAAPDSHVQYAKIVDVDITLAGKENVGVATTLVTSHEAAVNPHPQYASAADVVDGLATKVDATYVGNQLSAHVAAIDPHTQYVQTANLDAAISGIGTYATLTYVDGRFTTLIGGAPEALNTLNELSAALQNDSNFAVSITNLLAGKENINVASGLVADHIAAANPHPQYAIAADMTIALGTKEASGAAANAITAHVTALDPHTQYFNDARLTPAVQTLVSDAFGSASTLTFSSQLSAPAVPASGFITVYSNADNDIVALKSDGNTVALSNKLVIKNSINEIVSANAATLRINGATTTYDAVNDAVIIDIAGGAGSVAEFFDHSVSVSSSYQSIDVLGTGISAAFNAVSNRVEIIGSALPITGGSLLGSLILLDDPTDPLGAATKQYADNVMITHLTDLDPHSQYIDGVELDAFVVDAFNSIDAARFVGSTFVPTVGALITDVALYVDDQGVLKAKQGNTNNVYDLYNTPISVRDGANTLVTASLTNLKFIGATTTLNGDTVDVTITAPEPVFPPVKDTAAGPDIVSYTQLNFIGGSVSTSLNGTTNAVDITINAISQLSDDTTPSLSGNLVTTGFAVTSTNTLSLRSDTGVLSLGPSSAVVPTVLEASGDSLVIQTTNNASINLVSGTGAVTVNGNEVVNMIPVPATIAADGAGKRGEAFYHSGYLYVCVSTDVWVRSVVETTWAPVTP